MPPDTDPIPETGGTERHDAENQAQTVADDALGRANDKYDDSEHGGSGDRTALTPDDTPDLIDRMEQMVSSGHIDMDAYRGEPAHDDEPDTYGADPDEIDEADPIHGDS